MIRSSRLPRGLSRKRICWRWAVVSTCPATSRAPITPRSSSTSPCERPSRRGLEQIAALDLYTRARGIRPRDRPLGDAPITRYPVAVLPVVDVGDPGEACLDALPRLLLPDEPSSPWIRSPRRLKDAVLGKEFHDALHIVAIEGLKKALERSHVGRFISHLGCFRFLFGTSPAQYLAPGAGMGTGGLRSHLLPLDPLGNLRRRQLLKSRLALA